MISIHADMRSHGYATEDAPHTRIPGIWRKLHELFDLEILDERENAYLFSEEPDPAVHDEAMNIPEFELPEHDFGELMWHKRFQEDDDSETTSSPPEFPIEDEKALYTPGVGLLKDLPASERSRKTETPAEATPTPKNAKNARTSKAAAKSKKGAKPAKNSKPRSTVSVSVSEEEEEDEEEDESSEEEEDSAPTTRRGNRGRAKPAPKPKRRR
jgi:MRG-binding protein